MSKTQGNWFVEIAWRMPRIEVAGDICLRRPRPAQGCRPDDDDDDDDDSALLNVSAVYTSHHQIGIS